MGEVISLAEFKATGKKPVAVQPVVAAQKVTQQPVDLVVLEGSITTTIDDVEYYDYGMLVNLAHLSVLRRVLEDVQKNGLPKGAKLMISFDPKAAGVKLSKRLQEQFTAPEIFIVLDAWWEDLEVESGHFAVTLNFQDVRERLIIPFSAVTSCADQVTGFWMKFDRAPALNEPVSPEPPAA